MESFLPGRTTVGVVGTGKMGTPMARNLRRGDYAVVAFDTRPEALDALRPDGVESAESLADLAARCEVVITMLPDSNVVDRVVLGEGGLAAHMAPGKTILDMSSSYPPRTRALGEALAARGVHLVGAPVSGGVSGAEAATLAIMPGGPKEVVDAAMLLFECLGKTIVHVGEAVEAGHAMKCVNNFLSATNALSSMEAMALASKLGLDPNKTLEVLNGGTGCNSGTRDKWPKFLLPRQFRTGFTVGLMHKDLSMGADLARDLQATLFLLNHVRQIFGLGVQRFGADADQTLLLELIEEWAGQRVGAPPGEAPRKREGD